MIFNSFQFLWLFPFIFVVYYFVMAKTGYQTKSTNMSNYLLILISYGLYLQWKAIYAIILLLITALTFLSGLIIEHYVTGRKRKSLIVYAILLAILPLLVFKYYNFISQNLISLLCLVGIKTGLPGLNWVMPLGLSFYTLQAIGYVWDVYYRRIKAEHNWWDYMLFVCFFPQIASGPISKAKDLLPQIKNRDRHFCYAQAVQGLKWILWGMFLKVVVADRLGIYVDTVFNNYVYQSGFTCFVASVLYSFQIYSDFAGYSFMAVGVGELMGFELVNNFRRPYLSVSVTDFWHRWHISLSLWLKDYVYIPLGGNRCSKIRNYFNILITFLVSGIWHGANWTYIVWGCLHGIFQILEKFFHIQKGSQFRTINAFKMIITFVVINFLWIFFRMHSVSDAYAVIEKILTDHNFTLFTVSPAKTLYMIVGLSILIIKDLMDEYLDVDKTFFHNKSSIIRWSSYFVILYMIIACGVFNASQFIYVSF